MDDKTMLEWAAKAAGIDHWFGKEGTVDWDPLTDDGDALRLAVKLRLRVYIDASKVSAHYDAGLFAGEPIDGDAYAATRRAITRAAAEIGKAMEGK